MIASLVEVEMQVNHSVSPKESTAARAWREFHSTRRFGSLDGLRCLGVLAVIWHHGPGGATSGLASYGYLGVSLFFAISGFLITTLLLRENEKTGTISLRNFYWRRALRIFPLYFAVLGAYCILVAVFASGTEVARRFYGNLPYFLTYTSNWFVGTEGTFAFAWSLAAEEQFYSTWPPALRYLRPARAIWLAAILLAVTITVNAVSWPTEVRDQAWFVVFRSVPMAICWGCLVAFALHSRRSFGWMWRLLGHRWSVPVVWGLVFLVLSGVRSPNLAIHFLFGTLVAASVIREDHVLAGAMRQRWVTHLGVVSYGMYLLHGLAYDLLGKVGSRYFPAWQPKGVTGFVLAVVVTLILASVSFRYYERPLLRMKSHFGG